MLGYIARINIERGFGFVAAQGEPDHFFHFSALDKSLPFDEALKNRDVEFDSEDGPKGPRAVRIRPLR